MRFIPLKHKKVINSDPYFKKCLLTGNSKVEIHHSMSYGGRQISELWAYAPLSPDVHRLTEVSVHKQNTTKEYVQYLCLKRATAEDLAKYPKTDWAQLKRYFESRKGAFYLWCQANNFIWYE